MRRTTILAVTLVVVVGCTSVNAKDGSTRKTSDTEAIPVSAKGEATTQPDNGKTVTVTYGDNGKTLSLNSGQMLNVVLPVQLGTGQIWRARKGESNVLRLREGYPKVLPGEGKPGARQWMVFSFAPSSTGSEHVELVYGRANTDPRSRFNLTIRVGDDDAGARPAGAELEPQPKK